MNFELTKEQQMIRDMVREFAQAEIAPYARELDEKHEFRKESFDKMAELGLFGIPFPGTIWWFWRRHSFICFSC